MSFFKDQQEYEAFLYRKAFRSDVNKLGVLLLLFFGAQQGLAWGVLKILSLTSTEQYLDSSATMTLLLNGMLSTLIFFLIGIIYCFVRKLPCTRLMPFAPISGKLLAALCVIGLTVSVMSNYAADMVTDVFSLFGVTNRGGDITGSSSPPSIPIYYLTVAVLPAFTEEFAFRGIVMGSLRKHSDALALIVSSAAFALMHGNFIQLPFTFCCGLAFGLIALKTNSLLPSIIVHFLNNALSVTTDVLIAYRVVSVTVSNIIFHSLVIVLCICSVFLVRMIIREDPQMFHFDDSDAGIPFREKMKLTVSSPTMIAFAAIMLLYSVYILVRPYL